MPFVVLAQRAGKRKAARAAEIALQEDVTDVSSSSSADPQITRRRLRKQPDQPKTPEKLHGLEAAHYMTNAKDTQGMHITFCSHSSQLSLDDTGRTLLKQMHKASRNHVL